MFITNLKFKGVFYLLLWVLLIILIFIIYYIYSNHVHVFWKTLFKKGFTKNDDFYGLYEYDGKQGCGKTYSAVRFVKDMYEKYNYIVITNIKSYKASPHIYMDNILKIIEFYEGLTQEEQSKYLLFFDEIFTILQRGTRMNNKILPFLSQLRKRGIIFVTTAQEWRLIPLEFRLYVRYQVSCKMISLPFTRSAFVINKVNDGTSIKWSDDDQDFIAENLQTNIMKGNKEIIELYDTFETIATDKNLIK